MAVRWREGGRFVSYGGDVIVYYAAEHQWIIYTSGTHTHEFTTRNETLYYEAREREDGEKEKERGGKRARHR